MDLIQAHRDFFDFDFVRRNHHEAAKMTDAKLTQALLDPQNAHPLRPNCIFDVEYYAQNSTEEDACDIPNPIVRYLTKGAADDAWPNPFFDPLFFRRNVGSAARYSPTLVEHCLANLDEYLPAFHPFIDVGFICQTLNCDATGQFYEDLFRGVLDIRHPHPLFDVDYVRDHGGPDITNLRDAFAWYWQSDRDVATHLLFDVEYYQSQFQTMGAVLHSVYHYLISPQPVSPQPLLDPIYYRSGAIAKTGRSVARPLEHFIVTGQAMGIDPSPFFDLTFYRDQSHCGQDALQHYVAGGHKRFSPHPLINTLDDRLLSRASPHGEHSVGARMARWPEDVPISLTPDLDPMFLGKTSVASAGDTGDLRNQYFHHDYHDGGRPNGLLSAVFVADRLSALGHTEDTSLQTYFRKALHQCKRLLVALENLDDSASNRVWLDFLRSQLANPEVEFVVVAARGGALMSAFCGVAHVWVLSGQSTIVASLDKLRRSGTRLAEVTASNPPVAAFVEVDGSIVVTEALVDLNCPKIAFGGAGLARRRADEVHRLAVLTDHILCSTAQVRSRLESHFEPGDAPAASVFGTTLLSLPKMGGRIKRPGNTRSRLDLPEDAMVVLGSGPLDLENSVDLFGVVAAKCLSRADCPSNVYFVWHGGELKFPNSPAFYASYFVKSSAHPDRIRIVSEPDLVELLADATIYLKFCRDSADMTDVAAAKAAGLPIVMSKTHPESESVAKAEGMILVDSFDIDAACDALINLFTNPEDCKRLGAAGQQNGAGGSGLSEFIERMSVVLAGTHVNLFPTTDLGDGPKETMLIVASKKMADAVLTDPKQEKPDRGRQIQRLDPDQFALNSLPFGLHDHISATGCDEIVLCAGSEGLSRDFVTEFSHALWIAEGLTSELSEFYRLGLDFEKILIRNEKIMADMTELNPKIAALMTLLAEPSA